MRLRLYPDSPKPRSVVHLPASRSCPGRQLHASKPTMPLINSVPVWRLRFSATDKAP
jgi:hypothetical protein